MDSTDILKIIKERIWFYEFELPDGTYTETNVPAEILPIHTHRRDRLIDIIHNNIQDSHSLTAFDLASHEGYYSIAMSPYFKSVTGFEIRDSSRHAATMITEFLNINNVSYVEADLQNMAFVPDQTADLVLLYGLIYHMEDPIHVLRLASQMSRRHILVETQVFPYDINGRIEDGGFSNLRQIEGVFGLAPDYSAHREGGSTDVALVPSLNALLYLLRNFGFSNLHVLPSGPGSYEQFTRGQRVIVYGSKA